MSSLPPGIRRKRELYLEDIIDSMKEIGAMIDSGLYGKVDKQRVVDQLSELAFIPWSKSLRVRSVMPHQMKALDMLARYFGMFVERHALEDNNDLAKELKEAWGRVQDSVARFKTAHN